jgi:DNA-nicking Smr family endonuclease
MKRRTPRGLDPEELELWQRIARTTTPMERDASKLDPQFVPSTERKLTPETRPAIAPFVIGAKSDTALPTNDLKYRPLTAHDAQQIRMDRKSFQKMKRGKSVPEARLDLHGMNVAAAHSALAGFILSAQTKGKRLVLVITGKGRVTDDTGPIPVRPGILRQQVPQWLGLAPLSSAVLQVSEAHQRHGGSGAFYVYLRRR